MVQNEILEFKIFSNSIDEYKYSKRNPNPMLGLRENRGKKKNQQQQQTFSFLCYLLSFASKNKEKKQHKVNKIK